MVLSGMQTSWSNACRPSTSSPSSSTAAPAMNSYSWLISSGYSRSLRRLLKGTREIKGGYLQPRRRALTWSVGCQNLGPRQPHGNGYCGQVSKVVTRGRSSISTVSYLLGGIVQPVYGLTRRIVGRRRRRQRCRFPACRPRQTYE